MFVFDSLLDGRDDLEALVHQADLVHRAHHHNLQTPAVPTHQTEMGEMEQMLIHCPLCFIRDLSVVLQYPDSKSDIRGNNSNKKCPLIQLYFCLAYIFHFLSYSL